MTERHWSSCTVCGWRSSPTRSTAQADYAFRKHSCEKKRQADAALRRSLERHAAVDRTPKPCLHKRARHEHGSHACYVLDRCRCLPCTRANSAYESNRARQRAYGREAYVDAAPARGHVRALMAAGVGLKRIQELTGVSASTTQGLVYGRSERGRGLQQRITRAVEARILAVPLTSEALADGARIDATGTHRRVQALVTIGWSQQRIADALGMQRSNFGKMMACDRIAVRTARAVAGLYDQWWDRPPAQATWAERNSASRARNHARSRGWLPPLAWDDDTIDDPAATPVEAADVIRKRLKLPPVDELRWLMDTGESIAAIASRFGSSEDGVLAALRRSPAA